MDWIIDNTPSLPSPMDELLVPRHPDEGCHATQLALLTALPSEAARARVAQQLRFGNATYCYYHSHEVPVTEADFREWLAGLPAGDGARQRMAALGYAQLRDSLPLRRYVLEKNDIGLGEFLHGLLTPADWQAYQLLAAGALQPWLPPLT